MTDIEIIDMLIAYFEKRNRFGVAVTESQIAFHQTEIIGHELQKLLVDIGREWYYLPSDQFVYISRNK